MIQGLSWNRVHSKEVTRKKQLQLGMEFRLQEGKKPNHMIEKDEQDKRVFVESFLSFDIVLSSNGIQIAKRL